MTVGRPTNHCQTVCGIFNPGRLGNSSMRNEFGGNFSTVELPKLLRKVVERINLHKKFGDNFITH